VRISWRITKFVVWVLLIAFLVGSSVFSGWLGQRFEIHPGLLMSALILGASAALSGVIELQRRNLRRRLEQLPQQQKEVLQSLDPEIRYAKAPRDRRPSAWVATWIGSLWVKWPPIPWVVAPIFAYQSLLGRPNFWIGIPLVMLGFACGWSWWSVNVTLWRRWAARRGVDLNELQWRGESAGILWPRGHFLESTEIGNVIDRMSRRKA
jgi:hypothetical protein